MIILYDKSEDKEAKHNNSAEAGSHLPPQSQREAGQDIINTSGCYPTPFSPPANTLILLSVLSKHKPCSAWEQPHLLTRIWTLGFKKKALSVILICYNVVRHCVWSHSHTSPQLRPNKTMTTFLL